MVLVESELSYLKGMKLLKELEVSRLKLLIGLLYQLVLFPLPQYFDLQFHLKVAVVAVELVVVEKTVEYLNC